MIEKPYEANAAPMGNPVFVTCDASVEQLRPRGSRAVVAVICGLLCLAVVLVFCQTGGYDFVNYDDDSYVYENEHVNRGLTWDGLEFYAYHWHAYTFHPLSTYSHMLDCQLFGLEAGGHHAMNVLLHGITVVLLFLLVRQMTGRLWPSALLAALFAIHPLRVQSVAWISERKDVLSGMFFVLTLGAYVRYVRAPASARRYATVCLLYALGLLAKPMLVTLPMVLLLLDYWPLRRWSREQGAGSTEQAGCVGYPPAGRGSRSGDVGEAGRETEVGDPAELRGANTGEMPKLSKARHFPWHLLVEKIPLLLLSVADSALTVHTQIDAIQSLDAISWPARIANTLVAYVSYLGCFFWPQGLAILYPHPINGYSSIAAVLAAMGLVAASAGAIVLRHKAPYLLVGWLWYLGMLVPVIGLLQVGGAKMADRYTYLPQIGLVLGLVWAATDLTAFLAVRVGAATRRAGRFLLAPTMAGIIAALMVAAWQQAGYWRDSESLWVRGIMYPSVVAHYNLGLALAKVDRHREAIKEYQAALALDPNDQDTHNNLGLSYEATGQLDEALHEFRAVLKQVQDGVDSQNDLAAKSRREGNEAGAKEHLKAAAEKLKESVDPHKNLARMLYTQGNDREALEHWRAALKEVPKDSGVCTHISLALASSPDATLRDAAAAVRNAEEAVKLSAGKDASALDARAAAYAESGRFPEALRDARAALALATDRGQAELAAEIQQRLKLYEAGKPYRRTVTAHAKNSAAQK